MIKKTIRIDPNILSFFIREGCLKEFSQFIYLKSLHKNSCFFNYSKRSLAAESGISVSSVDKLVKFFINSGWCRMHCGNLIFNSIRNKKEFRKEIKFNVNGSWKQIREDLQLYILKKKQDGFEFYKKLGMTLNNPRGFIEYKSALRKVKKMKLSIKQLKNLPGENDFFKISMHKVAELFKCSVGSAYNLINKLRLSGRAFCVKFPPVVLPFKSAKVLSGIIGGGYHSNGNLFLIKCNQYDFNN